MGDRCQAWESGPGYPLAVCLGQVANVSGLQLFRLLGFQGAMRRTKVPSVVQCGAWEPCRLPSTQAERTRAHLHPSLPEAGSSAPGRLAGLWAPGHRPARLSGCPSQSGIAPWRESRTGLLLCLRPFIPASVLFQAQPHPGAFLSCFSVFPQPPPTSPPPSFYFPPGSTGFPRFLLALAQAWRDMAGTVTL